MRLKRLAFLFTALYFVFVGGAVYYDIILSLRVFHHGFVTVLFGAWLLYWLRRDGIPVTPLNPALYAGVAVWLVTAALSIDPRMAFEETWFLILHLLIFFVLVDLFQRGRTKWIMETQFIIGAVIVMISAVELASWYFGLAIGGREFGWFDVRLIPLEAPPRLAWAMNSTNWLGAYTAPLIIICGVWAYTLKRRELARVLWILTGLLALVLLLTQTRGGYLSFAAGISALTAIQLIKTENLRERLRSPLMIGALIGVGLVVIGTLIVVVRVSQSRGSGDSGRLDLYRSAVEMTVDYPVTGVGPGAFARAYREYRTPELARDRLSAAHNAYLGTAAEGGLISLAVSVWLGVLLLRAWWRRWQTETNRLRRLRLEATIAALLGIATHSMVDIFNQTPMVILIVTLVAYTLYGERSVLDERLKGARWPVAILLVIVAGYAVWFVQIDRAQSRYEDSLRTNDVEYARAAAELDPGLNLYDLQIAHLEGTIESYQRALELEPTWDKGWLNLAALHERSGDLDAALLAAERAYAINPLTSAGVHVARLAERLGTRDDEALIDIYADQIDRLTGSLYLPLSDFWMATDLRREALEHEFTDRRVDLQYRLWRVHAPERTAALVPESPQTAAEYWIAGEHALTVENDAEAAEAFFAEAIERRPRMGDYYASRARARLERDPSGAERDLQLATLLGTYAEYPNAIRADLTDDPALRDQYLARAIPGRPTDYAFSAVLYVERVSGFDIPQEMRYPGPGRTVLEPWYTLAAHHEAAGRTQDAISVYAAILDYAPEETEAMRRLNALR
jgi:O-antigen ligase/tetratricopeptide (TPR) repeat protein